MFPFVEQVYAEIDTATFGNAVQPIFTHIINPIIGLLFAIGIAVFVYGVAEMIWKGGDPDARTQGRNHMLSGIIGMFIMLSAWGIINLVSNTISTIK